GGQPVEGGGDGGAVQDRGGVGQEARKRQRGGSTRRQRCRVTPQPPRQRREKRAEEGQGCDQRRRHAGWFLLGRGAWACGLTCPLAQGIQPFPARNGAGLTCCAA